MEIKEVKNKRQRETRKKRVQILKKIYMDKAKELYG
jgi:hypothetical protein